MLQKTFFASKGTKNLVEYPKPGRDFSTKSRKRSGERRSGAGNRTHAARGKKRPAASAGRQTGRERLYAGHARPGTPACTGAGNNRGRGPEHAETRPAIAPVRVAEENPARKKPRTRKSPAQEKAPHGKEPRTEGTPHGRSPAQEKAPHGRSPAQEKAPHGKEPRTEGTPHKGKPRTRESPAQTRKNPARKDVSHREKAPPERIFRTKKNPARKEPRTRESPAQTRKNPARKKPRSRKSPTRENVSHEKKSRAEGTRPGDHFAHEKIPRGSGKYQR